MKSKLPPETLLAMNQRLIAIYEKKPVVHISKMTASEIRREKERMLTEQRIERLQNLISKG